jgi:hypothetical protein
LLLQDPNTNVGESLSWRWRKKPIQHLVAAMADLSSLKKMDKALAHLDSKVQPLVQHSRPEVLKRLAKPEAAKLNVALAYGISSLYYMLMKTT